ncbi:MAG: hypothetical protein P0Y49_13885 [Candidatus Pedobacter colombiensis]|uniref:Uncharacterized protein n=1 Tax=Candidatus Pedobacter colombiensis TaxID=3121371 RepID=A0AAJ5W4G4_9SPHI|nr:hypothetical protein [Pedobacter sp.]WEK17889.1 MAG: hypothetical protein P0Y49_13885 [Pedobacter sp.]
MKAGNGYMEDMLLPVRSFFVAIQSDPRIGATHIAVYMALYCKCLAEGDNEIRVFASDIMPVAKIFSRMTYCKVINDLCSMGYIEYKPSFVKPSLIRLLYIKSSL